MSLCVRLLRYSLKKKKYQKPDILGRYIKVYFLFVLFSLIMHATFRSVTSRKAEAERKKLISMKKLNI